MSKPESRTAGLAASFALIGDADVIPVPQREEHLEQIQRFDVEMICVTWSTIASTEFPADLPREMNRNCCIYYYRTRHADSTFSY